VEVRDWLVRNHRGRGRVLVHQWMLGEYLAWATDIPILGGLEQRAIHHADAHFFRRHPTGETDARTLREFLERYAVGFVVVRAPIFDQHALPGLERHTDLLHFVAAVGNQRIYLTKIHPDYLLRGKGRVVSQTLNSIRIAGAAGPDVVLRFHWMDRLRCRPGCTVERFDVPGDRVGFIRIQRPPERFEIFNGY
jgi:hypothetical protein